MKINLKVCISILSLVFIISGCKKNEGDSFIVEENGLTKDINDFVPQSVLDEMEDMGMPINEGVNPPNIQFRYLASPFILFNSNRSSDVIGKKYGDYYIQFSEQNNNTLTVKMASANAGQESEGIGGFIVGDDNRFSVFAKVNSELKGEKAVLLNMISGKVGSDGITDFYFANFMLDDNGDPGDVWIEVGDGRILYDSDGFSEKISSDKSAEKAADLESAAAGASY